MACSLLFSKLNKVYFSHILYQVPEKVLGRHVLELSGFIEDFGAFKFKDNFMTVSQTDGFKTYVQTDKPIYKPGQTVR